MSGKTHRQDRIFATGTTPEERRASAEARARTVARQLAALPTSAPHRRRGDFVLAVDPRGTPEQLGRPTHHHATGLPLIDLKTAPSSMEAFMRSRAKPGRTKPDSAS